MLYAGPHVIVTLNHKFFPCCFLYSRNFATVKNCIYLICDVSDERPLSKGHLTPKGLHRRLINAVLDGLTSSCSRAGFLPFTLCEVAVGKPEGRLLQDPGLPLYGLGGSPLTSLESHGLSVTFHPKVPAPPADC